LLITNKNCKKNILFTVRAKKVNNGLKKIMFENNNKLNSLIDLLGKYAPIIAFQLYKNNEISLISNPKTLCTLINILKKHIGLQYNLLSCISGVDLLNKNYRFLISYELLSITYSSRLRVKLFINEYSYIPSLFLFFINSNWWEREIWDLYGLFFENHPDLRRILTDYGFEGHPMRKDFPLTGFVELRYDNNIKSIISEPLSLSQEFRYFNYETPW
jgi:NADH dehydrogenase (ubiquinone) Fe-S protein 3